MIRLSSKRRRGNKYGRDKSKKEKKLKEKKDQLTNHFTVYTRVSFFLVRCASKQPGPSLSYSYEMLL